MTAPDPKEAAHDKPLWIALQAPKKDLPAALEDEAVKRLLKDSAKPTVLPLFNSLDESKVSELVARARQINDKYEPPDFSAWHQLMCPSSVDADELARALRRIAAVTAAYVMRPSAPPAPPSIDLNRQGYAAPQPNGVDAESAWSRAGGDGHGIGYVDLEQGWNLHHQDLASANISLISGLNLDYRPHGTQAIGVLSMADNKVGGIGIAHCASGRVVSEWRKWHGLVSYNTADAIVDAALSMSYGDVLVLQTQEFDPLDDTSFGWPCEILLGNYIAICIAVALGIVVIEPAGNGNRDLDSYVDSYSYPIFDRDHRDSGAILVGAATSTAPHARFPNSTHGKRVDCYAWGERIYTTDTNEAGTDDEKYTPGFNSTSGASAIVAGAALCVQGLVQASGASRLNSTAMRELLVQDGTPSKDPTVDAVGVMPNLRKIMDNL